MRQVSVQVLYTVDILCKSLYITLQWAIWLDSWYKIYSLVKVVLGKGWVLIWLWRRQRSKWNNMSMASLHVSAIGHITRGSRKLLQAGGSEVKMHLLRGRGGGPPTHFIPLTCSTVAHVGILTMSCWCMNLYVWGLHLGCLR